MGPTSENGLGTEVGPKGLLFFEVLEDLDGRRIFPDGVLGGIGSPDELLSGAEAFVAKRHGRVDDVLAVAADHHEPAEEEGIAGYHNE